MKKFIIHIYFEDIVEEFDIENYASQRIHIGRSVKNELNISSDAVLENHACINVLDDELELIDLSNGQTFYNGEKINSRIIEDGDVIVFFNPLNISKKAALIFTDKEKIYGKKIKYSTSGLNKIKIGREDSNNIVLKNMLVSGNHAEIIISEGNYFLNDLGSMNGTYLNGKLIHRSILKSGDIINISGHKLTFYENNLIIAYVKDIVSIRGIKEAKESVIYYPYFSRSPRLESALPFAEIDIPNPPPLSAKPTISWLAVLLPPIGVIAAMSVIGVVIWKSTRSPWIIIGTSLMSVMSLVVSIITYFSQKKKFAKDEKKRSEKYIEALKVKELEIENLRNTQKNIMCLVNPDINECLKIAGKRQRRLWERSPQHADFLFARIGKGNLIFNVKLNIPKLDMQIEQDPLQKEIQRFMENFKYLEDVPVCLPILNTGATGVVGSRNLLLQTARNMIVQIATHHAYSEVKIVLVYPENETYYWSWVRWLPHVWNNEKSIRFIAKSKEGVHKIFNHLYEIIKFRETRLAGDAKEESKMQIPYYLFFIADKALVENEILMEYLIHNNQKLGISSVFLFDNIQSLPQDCKYIISLESNKGNLIDKNNTMQSYDFTPDSVSVEDADNFARQLAPLIIKDIGASADLPNSVSLLELHNAKNLDELKILEKWKNSQPYKSLSAVIGLRAGNKKMFLDIHEKMHGPHGLIAGTTGSGKSELLQSYILSLAINYHPHDVAFLLIDYKGGGMAHLFKELPHLAGIITNLGGNQTNRALISIKSEIKRRQQLFDKYKVNHIDKYHLLYKSGSIENPLPHLIMIVDEFAELKAEQPDFMLELVSAARLGRSLGIHLILATQKPSGVVDEQIWGNTRFRICLKVQELQDSREVIKRPDAAQISMPGRAYIQVGNNEIFELFQSAYSGAEYKPAELRSNNESKENGKVSRVLLDGERVLLESQSNYLDDAEDKIIEKQKHISQLQAVIEYICELVNKEKIKKLPELWLPPLPEEISLEEIISDHKSINLDFDWDSTDWQEQASWISPIVGLVDDPVNQTQNPLVINFTREGSIAVYGGPGSGKTTFLQTMMMSLVLMHSPEDINIYILDFGSGILNVFSKMPHVGGVVMVDESNKLQKLMMLIFKEIEKRKIIFTGKGVGNYQAYRQSIAKDIPAIFIVVDNFSAILELYPDILDKFIQISREGSNLGIYLVLTANNPLGIGYRININIKMAVALQMPEKGAYMDIVGNTYGLLPEIVRGRGLLKSNPPLEFQTALPITGETEVDRTINIRNLSSKMTDTWKGATANPIPIMPEKILYTELLKKSSNVAAKIPFGLDFDDLDIHYLDLDETAHFLIAGKPQSGKTNFLKLVINYIFENYANKKYDIYIIDSFSKGGLWDYRENKNIKFYANNPKSINKLMVKIKEELEARKKVLNKEIKKSKNQTAQEDLTPNINPILLIIDDFKDFIDFIEEDAKAYLENIIIRERLTGFHIILSGLFDDINYSYEGIIKSIKSAQNGLLLADLTDQQIFNIRVKYSDAAEGLMPGEGYIVNRRNFKKVKIALV